METIAEAKEFMREKFTEGVICPCCNQFVKLYKRSLNSGMAITLYRILLAKEGFIDVKEYLRINKYKNSHDWTLLKFWGLLIPGENKVGQTNDTWRITPEGHDFILHEKKVPKYIYMYNQKVYKVKDNNEVTTFREALGSKFDYNELMAAPELK